MLLNIDILISARVTFAFFIDLTLNIKIGEESMRS